MIMRIILTPIYICMLMLRVIVDLALRLSAWIFYLIGGLFLLTTICCYYMQLESAASLHHMLIICGVLFMLPQAVTILSAVLEVGTEIIGNRIRGL